MENSQENTTQPPVIKRRSAVAEVISGGLIGGLIGGITSLFNKKHKAGKQIGVGLAVGAGLGLVSNIVAGNKAPEQQPLLPPPEQESPNNLLMGSVPQVLDMLVARGQLTPEQQATVLTEIKSGRSGFAGQIAVADGFTSAANLGQALADQSSMKAEAALADINSISQFGPLVTTVKANWGNNGVNPAQIPATRIDGMSAAANIAQNLVILANNNPQIVPYIRDGVVAAAYLTRGIAQGDSATVPLAKMSDSWRTSMNAALKIAAQANPQAMVDSNGKPVDVDQFIAARNVEINASIQQTLAQGSGQGFGQGR